MILYNITFVVDARIVERFKDWVSTTYIKQIVADNRFSNHLFARIVPQANADKQSQSFALQFRSADVRALVEWDEIISPSLVKQFIAPDSSELLLSFATFMEIID